LPDREIKLKTSEDRGGYHVADADLIWDTVIEQREKAQVTLIASGFA
jgi:hypothetical protein